MIKVKLQDDIEATFSDFNWVCNDELTEGFLNSRFDIDELSPGDVYRVSKKNKEVTGIDAVAFDTIMFLESEIIINEPNDMPEEIKGKVI